MFLTTVTEAPKIKKELSAAQIQVPALAANTEISFTSNIAFVNEGNIMYNLLIKVMCRIC